MICKVLTQFVKKLNADDKYSLLNRYNLKQPIHMQLSRKGKIFYENFFAFLKSILTFKDLKKKMNLIADVLPKLRTPKNVVIIV